MSRTANNFFTIKTNGALFDVHNETREFRGMGPDMGRVVKSMVVARVPTKADAELVRDMLTRKYTGDMFSIANTVSRRIGMLAIDNPHFAESIDHPTAY